MVYKTCLNLTGFSLVSLRLLYLSSGVLVECCFLLDCSLPFIFCTFHLPTDRIDICLQQDASSEKMICLGGQMFGIRARAPVNRSRWRVIMVSRHSIVARGGLFCGYVCIFFVSNTVLPHISQNLPTFIFMYAFKFADFPSVEYPCLTDSRNMRRFFSRISVPSRILHPSLKRLVISPNTPWLKTF